MYKYEIDQQEVSFKDLITLVAEECLPYYKGFVGTTEVNFADYDKARKLVNSLKRKAYRKFKKYYYHKKYAIPATETIIFGCKSVVEVSYLD